MSALEPLIFGEPDRLDARIRRAAQAQALVSLAKEVETDARDKLREAVDVEAERTGTGFSARVDGVRASLTDPQPKPQVSDRVAFGAWLDAEKVERVEVTYHAELAEALEWADRINADPTDFEPDDYLACLRAVACCLGQTVEHVLPADPFTPLIDSGRCVATDDGLVDTQTGELVPGVACTRGRPTVQVVADKEAKARLRGELLAAVRERGETLAELEGVTS